MAQELQLPASGRKSAIIDRIYRHSRQRPDQDEVHPTPSRPQPRTPGSARDSTADLERTVQRMLDNSIQELESRLLQHLVPPPPPEERDNLSLPSQTPDHGPRTANLTLRQEDSTDGDPSHDGVHGATTTSHSIHTPAQHPPLPSKVKQRILRGEFVEFDSLLSDALFPRHGTSPSPSFSVRVSSDPSSEGELLIAQDKPRNRRVVRDLASWMEAWNIYVSVLVAHYPARAVSLLAYQRIICDASLHFPPHCWLRYDVRFRACAAEDKTLRWDVKHNDLWLECFTQQPPTQFTTTKPQTSTTRRPCTYCGNLYHFPHNCPNAPFRAPRNASDPPSRNASDPTTATRSDTHSPYPKHSLPTTTPPTPSPSLPNHSIPKHICRDFNFYHGSCSRPHCRFSHTCVRCGDSSHGLRTCPGRPGLATPH